ncbi:hypothetical protein MERGE_000214 [Pneumocystis wakefieldiae]|uniref:TOG domain-containing protein n=1 Tax=Pneumocystis wakefieldiae TaxID=38082 RepID=A0A899FXS7_9ASCO|nr:hypothetical protein MERGE_000214 [Pneumocystis wakefieldiae]
MSIQDAEDLQEALRGSDNDRKLEVVMGIKRFIKRNDVSLDAVSLLFDGLRIGLISTNPLVMVNCLACTNHLIKRVSLQEISRLKGPGVVVLPLLIERLGDTKEKVKDVSQNALIELWRGIPSEVERGIKDLGFSSKNWRIREQMLEDANDSVRDAAKIVIIELFRNSPNYAKADLKRELNQQNICKKLVTYILDNLQFQGDTDFVSSRGSECAYDNDGASVSTRKANNESIASLSNLSSNYISNLSGAEMEQMEPSWVYSAKDLESEIQEMLPSFEGKETDYNWVTREKHIMRLRSLLRGNVYKEYSPIFLNGFKILLDGIIKAISSLRTTLSLAGLQFIKDVAIVAGSAIDQFVEILLIHLIRISGLTKKIISQAAQITVGVLIANVSYHPKIVYQLSSASQDKNPSTRQYSTGWLRILLEAHIDSRSYLENSGGLDTIEKVIRSGISDANAVVRTGMRDVLRCFSEIWPERAQSLVLSLDPVARKQFEKVFQNSSVFSKTIDSLNKSHNLSQNYFLNRGKSLNKEPLAKSGNIVNKKLDDTFSMTHKSSGLSSGPIRHGLGLPQRYGYSSKSSAKISESPTQDQSTGNTSNQTHTSPTQLRNETTPPRPTFVTNSLFGKPSVTTSRISPRKLTIIEQLVHSDWHIRVDGIITVACLLAKKTPPNYDNQKLPILPPNDILASTFQKLLNDSQPEVVNHLMAPEVIVEIAKIIPFENIVPRILLLSEMEDTERGHDIARTCLPAVKRMISDVDAAELLSKVLTSMGVSGVVPRKFSAGIFTTSQKRKIIHGVLLWMNELVERHNESIKNKEDGNSYFNDVSNFKFYVNRLLPMINSTKQTSINYGPLATLLKSLQTTNEEVFNKVLQTFEKVTVNALKNAWGIAVEEEPSVPEEKVAHIEDVLGGIPIIGDGKLDNNDMEHPSSSMESHSIKYSDNYIDSFEENIGAHNNFEDMTMIQISKLQANSLNNNVNKEVGSVSSDPSVSTGVKPTLVIDDAMKIHDSKTFGDKVAQEQKASEMGQELSPLFSQLEPALDFENKEDQDISIEDDSFSENSNLWFRKYMKKQLPITPLPNTVEDNIKLLKNLIERLENHDMDSYAFRKLTCISKEYSLETNLGNSVNISDNSKKDDVWMDGSLFDSLIKALLCFMREDVVSELKIQALFLLKYLFDHQSVYFDNHITNVFDVLLKFRSYDSNNNRVTCATEDMTFDIVSHFDPKKHLLKQPVIVICLSSLAIFIKNLEKTYLDKYLEKIPSLVIKALNDEDPEIRKESIAVCVSLNSIIKDSLEIFNLLQGLTPAQQNLLVYYFAKSCGKNI